MIGIAKKLILATAILSVASVAHAQGGSRFAKADANHDGRVTLREYENFVGSRLSKAQNPRAERFRQLDPERQASVLQKRFQKLDRGQKGYLVPADWPDQRGQNRRG